jgi:hypothetical protein
MIVHCPQCGKQLKLSEKIRESIQGLEPGRKIKVKCVHCSAPFGLDGADLAGKTPAPVSPASSRVRPPSPPDISWLREGAFEDQEVVEDIPKSLVLFPDVPARPTVVKAAGDLGYLVELVASAEDALDKMRFVDYAAIFLHSRFEEGGIEAGAFHHAMRVMPMSRRRMIFYVLVGEQFQTLYDLQALACSANLVVNDEEVPLIATILKKAIPEYEALFGPLLEELQVAGK